MCVCVHVYVCVCVCVCVQAAAMYRVASLPESEIISRRQALVALREQFNQQAVDMLKPWIHAA